jgi:hypothetical protein
MFQSISSVSYFAITVAILQTVLAVLLTISLGKREEGGNKAVTITACRSFKLSRLFGVPLSIITIALWIFLLLITTSPTSPTSPTGPILSSPILSILPFVLIGIVTILFEAAYLPISFIIRC